MSANNQAVVVHGQGAAAPLGHGQAAGPDHLPHAAVQLRQEQLQHTVKFLLRNNPQPPQSQCWYHALILITLIVGLPAVQTGPWSRLRYQLEQWERLLRKLSPDCLVYVMHEAAKQELPERFVQLITESWDRWEFTFEDIARVIKALECFRYRWIDRAYGSLVWPCWQYIREVCNNLEYAPPTSNDEMARLGGCLYCLKTSRVFDDCGQLWLNKLLCCLPSSNLSLPTGTTLLVTCDYFRVYVQPHVLPYWIHWLNMCITSQAGEGVAENIGYSIASLVRMGVLDFHALQKLAFHLKEHQRLREISAICWSSLLRGLGRIMDHRLLDRLMRRQLPRALPRLMVHLLVTEGLPCLLAPAKPSRAESVLAELRDHINGLERKRPHTGKMLHLKAYTNLRVTPVRHPPDLLIVWVKRISAPKHLCKVLVEYDGPPHRARRVRGYVLGGTVLRDCIVLKAGDLELVTIDEYPPPILNRVIYILRERD